MTNTIVILAAGMSSRMKKSTDSSIGLKKADEANKKSKSLITFGNKPFIFFLLENIVDAGFQNVIMVVGKDYEDFKNVMDKFPNISKINIEYLSVGGNHLKNLGINSIFNFYWFEIKLKFTKLAFLFISDKN